MRMRPASAYWRSVKCFFGNTARKAGSIVPAPTSAKNARLLSSAIQALQVAAAEGSPSARGDDFRLDRARERAAFPCARISDGAPSKSASTAFSSRLCIAFAVAIVGNATNTPSPRPAAIMRAARRRAASVLPEPVASSINTSCGPSDRSSDSASACMGRGEGAACGAMSCSLTLRDFAGRRPFAASAQPAAFCAPRQ